jgi:preprotein translocase subunit SecY
VIILVTGTIFAMWLGEKKTDKGIGNGISLLIMVGILARFPQAFISLQLELQITVVQCYWLSKLLFGF